MSKRIISLFLVVCMLVLAVPVFALSTLAEPAEESLPTSTLAIGNENWPEISGDAAPFELAKGFSGGWRYGQIKKEGFVSPTDVNGENANPFEATYKLFGAEVGVNNDLSGLLYLVEGEGQNRITRWVYPNVGYYAKFPQERYNYYAVPAFGYSAPATGNVTVTVTFDKATNPDWVAWDLLVYNNAEEVGFEEDIFSADAEASQTYSYTVDVLKGDNFGVGFAMRSWEALSAEPSGNAIYPTPVIEVVYNSVAPSSTLAPGGDNWPTIVRNKAGEPGEETDIPEGQPNAYTLAKGFSGGWRYGQIQNGVFVTPTVEDGVYTDDATVDANNLNAYDNTYNTMGSTTNTDIWGSGILYLASGELGLSRWAWNRAQTIPAFGYIAPESGTVSLTLSLNLKRAGDAAIGDFDLLVYSGSKLVYSEMDVIANATETAQTFEVECDVVQGEVISFAFAVTFKEATAAATIPTANNMLFSSPRATVEYSEVKQIRKTTLTAGNENWPASTDTGLPSGTADRYTLDKGFTGGWSYGKWNGSSFVAPATNWFDTAWNVMSAAESAPWDNGTLYVATGQLGVNGTTSIPAFAYLAPVDGYVTVDVSFGQNNTAGTVDCFVYSGSDNALAETNVFANGATASFTVEECKVSEGEYLTVAFPINATERGKCLVKDIRIEITYTSEGHVVELPEYTVTFMNGMIPVSSQAFSPDTPVDLDIPAIDDGLAWVTLGGVGKTPIQATALNGEYLTQDVVFYPMTKTFEFGYSASYPQLDPTSGLLVGYSKDQTWALNAYTLAGSTPIDQGSINGNNEYLKTTLGNEWTYGGLWFGNAGARDRLVMGNAGSITAQTWTAVADGTINIDFTNLSYPGGATPAPQQIMDLDMAIAINGEVVWPTGACSIADAVTFTNGVGATGWFTTVANVDDYLGAFKAFVATAPTNFEVNAGDKVEILFHKINAQTVKSCPKITYTEIDADTDIAYGVSEFVYAGDTNVADITAAAVIGAGFGLNFEATIKDAFADTWSDPALYIAGKLESDWKYDFYSARRAGDVLYWKVRATTADCPVAVVIGEGKTTLAECMKAAAELDPTCADVVDAALNYAAAAQTYFDYKTDALVYTGEALETEFEFTNKYALTDTVDETVSFAGVRLLLQDNVRFKVLLNSDAALSGYKLQVKNLATEAITYVDIVAREDLGNDTDGAYKAVTAEGIAPSAWNDGFEFCVVDAHDNVVSETLTYSVGTYVERIQDADFAAVCEAMRVLYEAAVAYNA